MGNIKYFFKSMYSNETVIKEHKKPWYLSFIMFIIALSLVWIPPFWRHATTDGSGTFQNVAGMDQALYTLVQDKNTGFGDSYIDENSVFVPTDIFSTNATYNKDTNPGGIELFTTQQGSEEKTKILSVYYLGEDLATNEGQLAYQNFVDAIFKDANLSNKNPFSYMVFTKTTFNFVLYQVKDITETSQPIAQYAGYYKEFEKSTQDKKVTFHDMILGGMTEDDNPLTYSKNNWNHLLDLGAEPQLFTEMILYLSLFLGGVVVCAILNGLIIFVMTRTKRSNYKEMTYWEATKAGTVLTFSPSLVGFILAFLMGNSLAFMIFLGVNLLRLVFSCNKINKRKEQAAPLYQARS